MAARWASAGSRLLAVPGRGLVEGTRLVVSLADLGSRSPGELVWEDGRRRETVTLVPDSACPPGVVGVSKDQLSAWRLESGAEWSLMPVLAEPVRRLRLSSAVDGEVEATARRIAQNEDLVGRAFPRPAAGATVHLEVDGTPLTVSAVEADGTTPVVQITEQTELELFSGVTHVGVDIVVLADTSGSMSVPDIDSSATDEDVVVSSPRWLRRSTPTIGRSPRMTRMQALVDALTRMAEARAQVSGRVSRVAVLAFSHEVRQVFPRMLGMTELGADTPQALQEFRSSIALLQPSGGSDIGKAIHAAAECLHRYGTPGNDRLIVLVSDGANWAPKGEGTTGEQFVAVSDPVTLAGSLTRALDFRIHAIGLSTREGFERYCREDRRSSLVHEPSLIPNHQLLERLVEATEGDPARIGGIDLLVDYFAGLGSGSVRRLERPRASALPPLQQEFLAALATPEPEVSLPLQALVDRMLTVYAACQTTSRHRVGDYIAHAAVDPTWFKRLQQPASSYLTFSGWIVELHKLVNENLDASTRFNASPRYPVPDAWAVVNDGRLRAINALRVVHAHDKAGEQDRQMQQAQDLMRELLGQERIADGDAASWSRLQLGLVERATQVFTDLLEAVRTGDIVRLAPQPLAAAANAASRVAEDAQESKARRGVASAFVYVG